MKPIFGCIATGDVHTVIPLVGMWCVPDMADFDPADKSGRRPAIRWQTLRDLLDQPAAVDEAKRALVS